MEYLLLSDGGTSCPFRSQINRCDYSILWVLNSFVFFSPFFEPSPNSMVIIIEGWHCFKDKKHPNCFLSDLCSFKDRQLLLANQLDSVFPWGTHVLLITRKYIRPSSGLRKQLNQNNVTGCFRTMEMKERKDWNVFTEYILWRFAEYLSKFEP